MSDVLPDGTYGVSITVDKDTAFSLNRTQALHYAAACFSRAMEADHDTAVMRMLTKDIGMEPQDAALFLRTNLRPDRRDDDHLTAPLKFLVGIARARHPRPDAGEFHPLLMLRVNGEDVGRLAPKDLRGHAGGVLSTLAAADLDASVRRCLVSTVGLGDEQARAFVGGLAEHMPDEHWLGPSQGGHQAEA